MEDFENEAEVPAETPAEVPAETPAEAEDDWDVDEFIGDDEDFELPDPNSVVTIRTSSGGDKYVPVSEPTAMGEILANSGMFIGGAVQYWLNGAQISAETLVPGGSTVTVIGSVKGG